MGKTILDRQAHLNSKSYHSVGDIASVNPKSSPPICLLADEYAEKFMVLVSYQNLMP